MMPSEDPAPTSTANNPVTSHYNGIAINGVSTPQQQQPLQQLPFNASAKVTSNNSGQSSVFKPGHQVPQFRSSQPFIRPPPHASFNGVVARTSPIVPPAPPAVPQLIRPISSGSCSTLPVIPARPPLTNSVRPSVSIPNFTSTSSKPPAVIPSNKITTASGSSSGSSSSCSMLPHHTINSASNSNSGSPSITPSSSITSSLSNASKPLVSSHSLVNPSFNPVSVSNVTTAQHSVFRPAVPAPIAVTANGPQASTTNIGWSQFRSPLAQANLAPPVRPPTQQVPSSASPVQMLPQRLYTPGVNMSLPRPPFFAPLAPPPLQARAPFVSTPQTPPPLNAQPPLQAFPQAPPPLRGPPRVGPPPLITPVPARPSIPPPPSVSQYPSHPSAFQGPPTSYPTPATTLAQPTGPQSNFQPQRQGQGNVASPYQSSVTRDGWNKGWGTDSVDLLQQRHVLPPDCVNPPRPILAQDFLRNCTPDILRCTFTKIPETKSLLQKVKMPFGILIHPFKDLEQLPVVSCQQIVRCRACRTYINPFVVFRGDRRWECNLCYRINDLPDEFQYDPVSQTYGDPSRRPEVREATIEYIAPSEYMLRPPQPAVYLWLLDTSRQAVDTGYLKVVCDVLLEQLSNIPGDRRALIGFMTFSATVQFYLMPEGSNSVNMLEVGDLEDIFVPHPDDLLVNINQQSPQLEDLLTSLPQTHATTTHTQSALGPALTAAYKLLYPMGGRLTVITSILPSIGPGSLQPREDPNQRAAADVLHLNPATDFYKKLALDCSGQQIAVDLFTLNSQYVDLATLSGVSKFSGGCVNHFPNFHVYMNPHSVKPFVSCLTRYITRKIGFEAVMRIRATRGLAITNFHGHFFVRSPDLLSLPNINPDAAFAMQVCIEEPLHNIRTASFQAALLYTSSRGERRIRVHTLCLPVTGNLHDVVNTVDQQAAVALLARMAVDRCVSSTSTDARDALVNAAIDALTSYRNSLTQSPGRALMASHNLKLLPLYTLALLKSISFRVGLSTKLDDRVYAMCELKTLPTRALIASVYPDLYPVHELTETGALSIDDEVVPQPPRLQLSAEYLSRDGAYLADTGSRMLLYVRSGVSCDWLEQVMGVQQFAALPQLMHQLPEYDNNKSRMLASFVKHLNSDRPYQSPITIIREDSPARQQFVQLLVEDRTDGAKSYVEFVQFLAGSVK